MSATNRPRGEVEAADGGGTADHVRVGFRANSSCPPGHLLQSYSQGGVKQLQRSEVFPQNSLIAQRPHAQHLSSDVRGDPNTVLTAPMS